MPMNPNKFSSNLSVSVIRDWIGNKPVAIKLTILSLFFMATLAGIVGYTMVTLQEQASDSTGVNIAGRQRMLTQKFTKEIFDELNDRQTIAASRRQTEAIATQIMEDRTYYNQNVIVKLQNDGMPVTASPDFQSIHGAIPAPATFVQQVSAELKQKSADYSYQLLSKFNVNPDKGLSDKYAKEAWDALAADSNGAYAKVIKAEGGGAVFQYAQADIASQGCVDCHNSLVSSPKHDFVKGDLMGILMVKTRITQDPVLAERLVNPPSELPADKTRLLFETSQRALSQGGITYADLGMQNEISLPAAPTEEALSKLQEVDALWQDMMISVEHLRTAENVNTQEYLQHVNRVRELNLDTLKTMNQAVSLFAENSVNKVNQMMIVEGVVLVIALLLVAWFSYVIVQMISRPLKQAIKVSDLIAKGDLSQEIQVSYRDETGQLLATMQQMQQKLTQVIEKDVQSIVDTAKAGDLSNRIALEDKAGFYARLSHSINELVDVNDNVVNDTVRMLSAMAKGDLSERIDNNYHGAFNNLKQDANQTVEKLTKVIEGDIQTLVNAARQGDLTQRISLEDKAGFFNRLSVGINELVAVNEQVVNDTVDMFSALSRGDLNQRITADYQGSFNHLKQDANQTADKLTQVIEGDIQALVNAAQRGDLSGRIDQEGKEGFFKTLSKGINELVNVNERVVKDTSNMFAAMAQGDLSQRIANEYQGAFNHLKQDANQTVEELTKVIEGDIHGLIASARGGDLTKRIDLENKQGFFKTLSQGVNELVDVNERIINDTVRVVGAMANGDLTKSIEDDYQGIFAQLKDDINNTIAKLTDIIASVSQAAASVDSASNELAMGNIDLSSRTEEQAATLEETAASMEEMASTVQQNAQSAFQANDMANEAQQAAMQGGAVVNNAIDSMAEISSASKEIADIINVMDEIAFQTNLLAVNAAVEAARAGEQGRGFAVVATEVRQLAQRSASSAQEIKALIGDSVDKVQYGTKLVNESGKTLEEIVASVKRVCEIMENISTSAKEQSLGIDQVNVAVSQMDQMTQQNAALVEEATAASKSAAEQAKQMSEQMTFFTLGSHRLDSMAGSTAMASSHKPVLTSIAATNPTEIAARGKPLPKAINSEDIEWQEF